MTKIYAFPNNDQAMDEYRSTLTGERIGWTIFQHPSSFSPVHRILFSPLDGPVILVYDEVWEVSEADPIFATEEQAKDKFWEERTRT